MKNSVFASVFGVGLALATAATALNGVALVPAIDRGDRFVDLPTVRADRDGFVEVRNIRGVAIGREPIRAGANANVRVRLTQRASRGLEVVLFATGDSTPLAERRIRVK